MLILHTADIHLYDSHKYSVNNSRLMEIKKNLLLIVKYGAEMVKKGENVILVIAGDIFHNYNPDEKLLKVFSSVIKTAMLNGLVVRIITGNHDTDGVDYSLESMNKMVNWKMPDFMSMSVRIFPIVKGKLAVYQEKLGMGKSGYVNFVYVPWQKEMVKAVNIARGKRLADTPNVLVLHGPVAGAMANSSYTAKKDMSGITPAMLAGWDYVALGDFHKYQCLSEKDRIYYSGSIVKLTWDERNEEKYFNVFDSITKQVRKVKLPDVNFIEWELNYNQIDSLLKENLTEVNDKAIKDSFIRLLVKGRCGFGEKISLLKKHLYDCGARDVFEKIISDERVIDVEEKKEVDLNLDIKSACMNYLKNENCKDVNYKMYIEKKIMENNI